MNVARLELDAPARRLGRLGEFYGDDLGIEVTRAGAAGVSLSPGDSEMTFRPSAGDPFYHFALLVPDGRFSASRRWIEGAVELLDGPDGGPVVSFPSWRAEALYFLDPAGNIVELISHGGLHPGDAPAERPFRPEELAGISEAALIVEDPEAAVRQIGADQGLPCWDGDPARGIAFVGERAHTLVIFNAGRGLLPTGAPAEVHPIRVTIERADGPPATVRIDDELQLRT